MERGQKIALVGANGIGKTTLLRSILGEIPALSGSVHKGENHKLATSNRKLKNPITTRVSMRFGTSSLRCNQFEVRAALARCGLTTKHIESKIVVLSGGEKAKVRLCKLINRETNLLVLDEPTNHLDVDAKDELKRALHAYKGSIMLISHEPDFYRDVVTETWNCESWTTKVF